MDRSNYGSTAEIIGQVTDPVKLTAMLRNPQYAGFTNIIIARLTEINHMRQAAQGAAPTPPTVAQQAIQGAQQANMPPQQAPQQAMARGGIVAFKHGGKVKGYAKGGKPETMTQDDYDREREKAVRQSEQSWLSNLMENTGDSVKKAFLPTPIAPLAQQKTPVPISTSGATPQPDQEYPVAAGDTPTIMESSDHPYTQQDKDWFSSQGIGSFKSPQGSGMQPDTQQGDSRTSVSNVQSSGGVDPTLQQYIKDQTIPDKSLAARFKERQDMLGPTTELDSARAELAKMRESREAQAGKSVDMAMIRAGLGMAQDASTNPRSGTLGNLAAGAIGGLDQYTAERGALNKDQAEELQRRIQLGSIDRQERAGMIRDVTTERGQDVRSNQQLNKDLVILDRQSKLGIYQADKASAAGNSAALAAQVRELGDLHRAATASLATAAKNVADARKGMDPNEIMEAQNAYKVAQANETNLANAIMKHAGGGGIIGLEQANPGSSASWITQKPQGSAAPLKLNVGK